MFAWFALRQTLGTKMVIIKKGSQQVEEKMLDITKKIVVWKEKEVSLMKGGGVYGKHGDDGITTRNENKKNVSLRAGGDLLL